MAKKINFCIFACTMQEKTSFTIAGNIVDLQNEKIFKGLIYVEDGFIKSNYN